MVFKPAYLARLGIQKTFTHGYIQSLVAASQSSSASHNTQFSTLSNNVFNYFAKPGGSSSQTHANAHLNASLGSGAGPSSKAGHHDVHGSESGLAAYYAAWNKHQRAEDKEWHQFQFAKRIGWKPPTTIPEANTTDKHVPKPYELHENHSSSATTERARSTSAVDEIKRNKGRGDLENTPTAHANEAVVETRQPLASETTIADTSVQLTEVSAVDDTAAQALTAPATPSSLEFSSPAHSTAATTVSDSEPYTEHLATLAEEQKYGDVPALFESMLKSGIKPSPSAYNALLLAAINLPKGKHQVVPKVLDVYSDMLRRQVAPDTATYTILIELLAARTLDVTAMKAQLNQRLLRYGGMDQQGSFMLRSDETEYKILAEDDSLSLAIKLFDTAAAIVTSHIFPGETYRLLISACAEQGRVSDMVRIYADMESRNVLPPTSVFAPMIKAFASSGDLRSSVECYDEYKALAIANDEGKIDILRKDEDVYAAVIKAYATCDRLNGGLKFLGKIEDSLEDIDRLAATRNAVAIQALIPRWISMQQYHEAITHASERVTGAAKSEALATICIDAADKGDLTAASEAYGLLAPAPPSSWSSSAPVLAMLAAYVRAGETGSARAAWQKVKNGPMTIDMVEPATMYSVSLIGSGAAEEGLQEAYKAFASIRSQENSRLHSALVAERIDEAIELIGQYTLKASPFPSGNISMGIIRLMVSNGGVTSSIAENVLAGLGPAEISQFSWSDIDSLMQLQAGLLIGHTNFDVAHTARFGHLLEVLATRGAPVEPRTSNLVEQALLKIDRPDLVARWRNPLFSPASVNISPTAYSSIYSPPSANNAPAHDSSFDPYAASTDFKGSSAIAEILEQTHGKHSSHLNDAMTRFRNIRRAGRHPRYVTYARLISAAAKENRLNLARDVVAMAEKDVPIIPQNHAVTHGWISILDAMVGACLTVGNRELAAQFHQELLNIGAAPSANTFGLYITTLKESTKTFDEATEAVKIFHRAKAEGVEPSSFLYNALIGKLGKARRIDDCLFYFAEMRNLGIRPTSVTYGTIVNALCRVSDDKFAEELFEEMESMPNYKPRPAPYNSLMQYFLTTKRDRTKVLSYYDRMRAKNIEPTMHTFKLLIDTHATLEPVDMPAAESVLASIRASGAQPEAVHYASLIHAKGCVLHDLPGARATFDTVIAEGRIPPQASLYQAMFESMVANHQVALTEPLIAQMAQQKVSMTPYIANTLIHGWALEKDIVKARSVFDSLGMEKREPSTYEAMTRAYLAVEDHGNAMSIVGEALRRGYPSAVANKICDLVGGGTKGS